MSSRCFVQTSSNDFLIRSNTQQNYSEEQADSHGKEEIQHGSQKGKRTSSLFWPVRDGWMDGSIDFKDVLPLGQGWAYTS